MLVMPMGVLTHGKEETKKELEKGNEGEIREEEGGRVGQRRKHIL